MLLSLLRPRFLLTPLWLCYTIQTCCANKCDCDSSDLSCLKDCVRFAKTCVLEYCSVDETEEGDGESCFLECLSAHWPVSFDVSSERNSDMIIDVQDIENEFMQTDEDNDKDEHMDENEKTIVGDNHYDGNKSKDVDEHEDEDDNDEEEGREYIDIALSNTEEEIVREGKEKEEHTPTNFYSRQDPYPRMTMDVKESTYRTTIKTTQTVSTSVKMVTDVSNAEMNRDNQTNEEESQKRQNAGSSSSLYFQPTMAYLAIAFLLGLFL
ncbi:hypothetical protein BDF20DRAFT_834705 [Mycotypha africana]|uniref:uncharacterized protein n=1 Tax=Mycotypha africana TaxID=64632 RepID=UPI002301107C|nr:uncharacterized protein BDF20DRAFT_834705 [Mycotypha africana]KAI8982050.1 hypothetical protein BDF20DRAFT_834705 [Mycotypha africana]